MYKLINAHKSKDEYYCYLHFTDVDTLEARLRFNSSTIETMHLTIAPCCIL